MTDAGLVHLRDMKQLRSLDLSGTALSDAGLERLGEFKQLTSLSLLKTKVTAEGVKKLTAGLPACQILWDGGVIEPRTASTPKKPERIGAASTSSGANPSPPIVGSKCVCGSVAIRWKATSSSETSRP